MEDMSYDKVKFDAVWQRVTAESAEGANCASAVKPEISAPIAAAPPLRMGALTRDTGGEEARIAGFMDAASELARYCRKTAARCPGKTGRLLSEIADCECRHLRTLRAEYFVLTGGTYCPKESNYCVYIVSEALRNIWKELSRCAEEYRTAAGTASPALACTYDRFACDETREASAVVRLIEGMVC